MDATTVKSWPFAFLASERRTPPRLLPLWAMAIIALAGHTPGSSAWGLAGILALALGILVAPLVGTIAPTVAAYVSLLALVAGMVAVTWVLPIGEWYHDAWIDHGSTGLLAMVLLGAVGVGGVSSSLWALLVGIEAGRRYVRRVKRRSLEAQAPLRAEATADAGDASPPVVAPAVAGRGKWAVPLLRAFTAIVYLALLVPLPSFLLMSGVYLRPAVRPHEGLGGLVGDGVTASVWPIATIAWLAVGAFVAWLAWQRNQHQARAIGIGVGAFVIVVVILAAATFALVPTGGGGQSFAPAVLEYCPVTTEEAPCQPEWLFNAPDLAEFTQSIVPFVALTLAAAAAAMVAISWRGRGDGKAAAPRA